jgi:glycosyltransferase involved in cell wall biosynthesis
MILKNEGKTIRRCLESMAGVVDEWIIGIDDKTTDDTKSVVRKFFAESDIIDFNLYDYTWQDSFCKARNEGMDKATGDYILIMDGHEYFPKEWDNIVVGQRFPIQEMLIDAKKKIGEDKPDEVYFYLYQQPFAGFDPAYAGRMDEFVKEQGFMPVCNNFFLQPRIYRNAPEIRFGRASHNTILGTDKNKMTHMPEFILIHDAPGDNREDRKNQRATMNVRELKKNIRVNRKDSRAMFYIGNTLVEAKRYKEAIKYFDRYLKVRDDDTSEKYQVYMHKALCLRELKMHREMVDCLQLAKAVCPMRRDAYALLSDLYMEQERWKDAIWEITTSLRLNPQNSRMFQNGAAMTFDPHRKLATCYEKTNEIPKALAHLRQAYEMLPNPAWLKRIKELQKGKMKILLIDRGGSFTKDFIKRLNEKYEALWADRIWAEWGNDDSMLATTYYPQKTVVRIHGYEAYCLEKLWPRFNWECKKVVFVADHIRDRMIDLAGVQADNSLVIHNGVDTEKFYIEKPDRDWQNIGYAGQINTKKNPFLLLQIIKNNPKFMFHLRITHQDPFWIPTFEYELKDCKNVVYHGWYENLSEFWNKMSGVISTSIIESFSYNVAEAMACGCKPYIYDWKGARDLYKREWVFDRFPIFQKKVSDEERLSYRKFILERYNNPDSLEKMEKVLVEG